MTPFYLLALFPLLFATVGAAFIRMAVHRRRAEQAFVAAAERADGIVTDVRWKDVARSNETRMLAFALVRFRLPDGREVHGEAQYGTQSRKFEAGQAVTVLYDPADPTRFRVEGAAQTGKLVTGAFVGLGGIFLVSGLVGAVLTVVVVAVVT